MSLPIWTTALGALTFRITREEMLALDRRHLAFGMICTWIVGMGRYWDDPGAHLAQHLGLGSVIYVLVLAGLFWVIFRPLGAQDWTYRRVLTLITMTAPPALLYAIPVERFMSLRAATDLNVWFLAIVAIWRVGLFFFFAVRLARLSVWVVLVGTLLPLTLIVTALAVLNLERAVFAVMAGLQDHTANDGAYLVVLVLSYLSVFAFAPLLIAWIALAVLARRRASITGP